jgi:hypothetical protein
MPGRDFHIAGHVLRKLIFDSFVGRILPSPDGGRNEKTR